MEIKTALLAASILLIASNADAFTLLGSSTEVRGWSGNELSFHLNPDGCPENINSLLAKSRAVWNSVPTSRITLSGGTETNATIDDVNAAIATNVPVVLCITDMAALNLDGSIVPAVAFGQSVDEHGMLNYGAIVINVDDATPQSITRMMENTAIAVIAHEMGHVLGLGHSTESKALMHHDVTKRRAATLHQDDIDGLNYLYPRNEFGGDGLMGGCTIGSRKNKTALDPSWMALLLIPAIGCLRRRWNQ